ncbi:MAG: VOC family protein [Pseudomonadota bacterium]
MSTPPFALAGLDHVVLLVDDLDRAQDFYLRVIGCTPGYSYPDIGMEQLWCGNALIGLWDINHQAAAYRRPAVNGGRNVDHICLALGPFELDDLQAHLAAHGVAIERIEFQGGARGMGHAVYIEDPFGNRLELKGPPPHPLA